MTDYERGWNAAMEAAAREAETHFIPIAGSVIATDIRALKRPETPPEEWPELHHFKKCECGRLNTRGNGNCTCGRPLTDPETLDERDAQLFKRWSGVLKKLAEGPAAAPEEKTPEKVCAYCFRRDCGFEDEEMELKKDLHLDPEWTP
jgi:hypothetical protein